jgi:uncharacterized protein YhbP (UPF0306 family)
MALHLPDPVARYLAQHHVMTLATQGPDGPWASAVFYAPHGDALVFLSSPSTRHGRNLAADARCSAAIHSDVDDWQLIRGIQLEGRVDGLDGDERERAIEHYAQKFPFVRPAVAAPAVLQALARVRWYRLRIERLHFIDNRRGFGQRQTFEA